MRFSTGYMVWSREPATILHFAHVHTYHDVLRQGQWEDPGSFAQDPNSRVRIIAVSS